MAILKSGPLIALSKSVGGLNFYRADGTQYVRSKPVLPEGYVPTVNQLLARQLFGLASKNIDRISLLAQMMDLNYSLVNKNATKTYRDVAIGFMMRYLCRDADGKPYSFEAKQDLAAHLEIAATALISGMVPLSFQNAVPWPVGVTYSLASNSHSIELTEEGWRYWYYQLLEAGYYPKEGAKPTVLYGSVDNFDADVGPWRKIVTTDATGPYRFSIDQGALILDHVEMVLDQWSLAYELDPAFYDGLTNLYVVTAPFVTHQSSTK